MPDSDIRSEIETYMFTQQRINDEETILVK